MINLLSSLKFIALAASTGGAGVAGLAHAQAYPNKPVRMIVPFAAGGGTDIVARTMAPKLSEAFGQPFVVENRAGANANIGMDLVAKSPADGYTLSFTSSSLAINPSLYKKLTYDPIKDFAPITLATLIPFILVAHPSLPVNSLRELVAFTAARPRQLSYASSGAGNATHLSMALFERMAKLELIHIPYKGTGQGIIDLMGGHVQLMFGAIPSTLPQVRAGKLKLLAVSSAKRSAVLPGAPTVAEGGVPGYELTSWYGALAPAGTPSAIVDRLNGEMVKALNHPDIKARLTSEGAEPAGNTPRQFAAFILSERDKYAEVVSAARVPVE
jgi:tripartite-type tricarboxylate transporter receptor subunit TctC